MTTKPEERAEVERLLSAQRIAPEESLAVRIVGTVGPNGSWAFDRVDVVQERGRVVLVPRVRRVAGDFFTQAVVPLDHVVRIALPAGRHVVEVQGRESTLTQRVMVERGARRAPPEVRFTTGAPSGSREMQMLPVTIVATSADGFVSGVEVREVAANERHAWRPPDGTSLEADGLHAWVTVQRPPGDGTRTLEIRAVDGQGVWCAEPARLDLPPR